MDMMPMWEDLAIEENPSGRVTLAKVDCELGANVHLCRGLTLPGYPAVGVCVCPPT